MDTAVLSSQVPPSPELTAQPARLPWSRPVVESLDTAPEVTAYAGKDETWP